MKMLKVKTTMDLKILKSVSFELKPFHRFILTSFFICFHLVASACICAPKELNSLNDIERYKFIGIVKVDSIFFQKEDTLSKRLSHTISISIKELYRGDSIKFLKVSGGNYRINDLKITSCDMGISKGEEWFIFAYSQNDSTLKTGYCTFSMRYKNVSGERAWQNEWVNQRIQKINEILNIQSLANDTLNGTYIERYPNGNIEIESNYLNGKLNGKRIISYSTGQPMIEEYYINGKKNGKSIWYYPNGSLRRDFNYINDSPVYSCLEFYPNNKLAVFNFYTSTGINYFGNTFSINGSKSSEHKVDTLTNEMTHKTYFDTGELESESIRTANSNFLSYFFKNGKVKSAYLTNNEGDIESETKIWDEKGELIYHVQYSRGNKKNILIDNRGS